MPPSADRARNRLRHRTRGHLIEPMADAAQSQLTQRGREDLRETLVTQEPEHDRWVCAVEKLERHRGAGRMHAISQELALERVERAVRLAP